MRENRCLPSCSELRVAHLRELFRSISLVLLRQYLWVIGITIFVTKESDRIGVSGRPRGSVPLVAEESQVSKRLG